MSSKGNQTFAKNYVNEANFMLKRKIRPYIWIFLCVLSNKVINSWDENKWSCKKDLRVCFMTCNWFLLWAIKSGTRFTKNWENFGNDAMKYWKCASYVKMCSKGLVIPFFLKWIHEINRKWYIWSVSRNAEKIISYHFAINNIFQ